MRSLDVLQGSPEWMQARLGKITSSRVAAVLAKPKRGGGELKCRSDYRLDLVAERLTGRLESHYVSAEMRWGTENELFARSEYELRNNVFVDEAGFVLHALWDFAGCSPDGIVGRGCVEIKCPKTTTHLAYRKAAAVPDEYLPQCLWVMLCTESEWCDFISYDPRLPEALQFFCHRIKRDKYADDLGALELAVYLFNSEINAEIESLLSI